MSISNLTKRYPVVIEHGTDTTAFGVIVPDLPGCFSAGDTLEEALACAEEAAAGWIDATLDAGQAVPIPSRPDAFSASFEYSGCTHAVISVRAA